MQPTLPICSVPSIGELVLAYDDYSQEHYLRDGGVSYEYDCMRYALVPLLVLFASTSFSVQATTSTVSEIFPSVFSCET